jgi:hypothetical protein
MNLPQALEIVKDHIRIGKGMELTNGVPEALEMVVEELEVTQKALELACIDAECANPICMKNDTNCNECVKKTYLAQAKEARDETP